MRVVLVGTSHHRAPVALRERMHFQLQQAPEIAARLAGRGGEAVALSTCNRTELYVADTDPEAAVERAYAELLTLSDLSETELAPILYTVSDEPAALHLFRVAAGLDSLVPGEGQILGQVRLAFEHAREAGATGPILNRMFRQALRAGKRVRTETAIAENPASVSSAAAELASRVFGELEGCRILVIGAGKISELAAVNLISRGVATVLVANRTIERAEPLARRFGGRAIAFDAVEDELGRTDIVISSTSAPGYVLTAAQVQRSLKARRGRPIFFIDIAVPRDLDPAINQLEGCYLYDIDDLRDIVEESLADRRREAVRAETIVSEEAIRFQEWQQELDVVPAITSLRQHAEEIRAAELARVAGRLDGLSPRERRAVEALTAQIVNKLLHTPTVRMKEAAGAANGVVYAETVRHLFGLDDGTPGTG